MYKLKPMKVPDFLNSTYEGKFLFWLSAGSVDQYNTNCMLASAEAANITEGTVTCSDQFIREAFTAETLMPDSMHMELKPLLSCNYHCKNCCAQLGGYYENDVEDVVANSVIVNKAAKDILSITGVKKVNAIILGGEVTLAPIEELKKCVDTITEGLPLQSVKILTNLSCSSEYTVEMCKHLVATCEHARLLASFHDSILTANKARQKFFSKVLLASLLIADVEVSNTVDFRNQWMQAPLLLLRRLYNTCYKQGLPPLRTPGRNVTFNMYYKEGYVGQDPYLGARFGFLKQAEVCNGLLAGTQISAGKDTLAIIPLCLTSYKRYVSIDGKDTPYIYITDKSKYSKENLGAFKDLLSFADCRGCLHACNPCCDVKVTTKEKAKELGIKFIEIGEAVEYHTDNLYCSEATASF